MTLFNASGLLGRVMRGLCLLVAGALAVPSLALADDQHRRRHDGGQNRGYQQRQSQPRHQPRPNYSRPAPPRPQHRPSSHARPVPPPRPQQHHVVHHHRVDRLPPGYQRYHTHGRNYYYHHGRYYNRHANGYYYAVRPPRGFWLAALPIGFAALVIGGITYYSYESVYYQPAPGGYVVVDPPPGVMVEPLP